MIPRRRLGRTGLEVTVLGLGAGGSNRLGLRAGRSDEECARFVRTAIDLGVNYIDTAADYGTEAVVGRGIRGVRDEVILSTKANPGQPDGELLDRAGLRASLERSLRRLGTDVIDVFHLHGVSPRVYDYCVAELVPEMFAQRDKGRIRFIAMSEAFALDPGHEMLARAARDDWFDVVMLGFNLLNHSARRQFLGAARQRDIGVEVMYAVRHALSHPDALRALVTSLVERGALDGSELDGEDPLGFLVHAAGARSLADAAYRYAAHEPGCHLVLSGTGSVDHLRDNIRSVSSSPLPAADIARLEGIFGGVDGITGN